MTIKYSFLLLPLLALMMSCGNTTSPPPNIILINADDLSAMSLGIYGNDVIKTPRLDKMAAEGTLFTHGYSPASTCGPSRLSLLLGKHTGHIPYRMNSGDCVIPAKDVCFPELLQTRGYTTAMFGKNGGIKERRIPDGLPSSNGFDLFVGTLRLMAAHQFYIDGRTAPQNNYPFHLWKDSSGVVTKYPIDADRYTQNEYMQLAYDYVKTDHKKPFFLYLPVQIPHYELVVPEKGDADYHPSDEGLLEQYLDESGKSIFGEAPFKTSATFQRPNDKPAATYAAMISRLDRDIGRLLDLLIERGLNDNTIVLFTSDNGGTGVAGGAALSINGNLRSGKGNLYEGGLRVPYIFWGKDVPKNKVIADPIVGYDIAATLLDYADVTTEFESDGISWKEAVEGENNISRDYIYWENYHGSTRQAVLIDKRYKAIRTIAGEDYKIHLYDITIDPSESLDQSSNPEYNELLDRIMKIFQKEHIPTSQHRLTF